MSKPLKTGKPDLQPDAQREALRRSEKKADEALPENFKEAETAQKIVTIGPDLNAAPIRGIDPTGHPRLAGSKESSFLGEEDPDAAMDDPAMRDAIQGESRAVSK